MSKLHQVESYLKKLKLNGMADTLEIRLGGAQQESLGYLEFLEFLLQDEMERRHQKGPVGVGKTFIAQALGYQACVLGHRVLFTKTTRLLADLGGGHADGTYETRLKSYLRPDVLILDDFCLTAFTEQQSQDLYRLIDERLRTGPIIATSNRSPEHWYEMFPNPVIGEAILDRLVNTSHVLTLTGKSYRPRLRPSRRDSAKMEVTSMH